MKKSSVSALTRHDASKTIANYDALVIRKVFTMLRKDIVCETKHNRGRKSGAVGFGLAARRGKSMIERVIRHVFS